MTATKEKSLSPVPKLLALVFSWALCHHQWPLRYSTCLSLEPWFADLEGDIARYRWGTSWFLKAARACKNRKNYRSRLKGQGKQASRGSWGSYAVEWCEGRHLNIASDHMKAVVRMIMGRSNLINGSQWCSRFHFWLFFVWLILAHADPRVALQFFLPFLMGEKMGSLFKRPGHSECGENRSKY